MSVFSVNLPTWNNEGVAPNSDIIQDGWQVGDRPPADWFNWQWNLVYKCIGEIRDYIDTKVSNKENISLSDANLSGSAYTVTSATGFEAEVLEDGFCINIRPLGTCPDNPTLNIDGLGAKPLYNGGYNVKYGALKQGRIYTVAYNQTDDRFEVLNIVKYVESPPVWNGSLNNIIYDGYFINGSTVTDYPSNFIVSDTSDVYITSRSIFSTTGDIYIYQKIVNLQTGYELERTFDRDTRTVIRDWGIPVGKNPKYSIYIQSLFSYGARTGYTFNYTSTGAPITVTVGSGALYSENYGLIVSDYSQSFIIQSIPSSGTTTAIYLLPDGKVYPNLSNYAQYVTQDVINTCPVLANITSTGTRVTISYGSSELLTRFANGVGAVTQPVGASNNRIATTEFVTRAVTTLGNDITGNAANTYAPIYHATNVLNTFGTGNGTYEGHVRLMTNINNNTGVNGGYAATPQAVNQLYNMIQANTSVNARKTFIIYVDNKYTGTSLGTEKQPYKTVQEAISAVDRDCVIQLSPDTYTGNINLTTIPYNVDIQGSGAIGQRMTTFDGDFSVGAISNIIGISHIYITGSASFSTASGYIYVDNCHFTNFTTGTTTTLNFHLIMDYCEFTDGIQIYGTPQIVFRNCDFSDTATGGRVYMMTTGQRVAMISCVRCTLTHNAGTCIVRDSSFKNIGSAASIVSTASGSANPLLLFSGTVAQDNGTFGAIQIGANTNYFIGAFLHDYSVDTISGVRLGNGGLNSNDVYVNAIPTNISVSNNYATEWLKGLDTRAKITQYTSLADLGLTDVGLTSLTDISLAMVNNSIAIISVINTSNNLINFSPIKCTGVFKIIRGENGRHCHFEWKRTNEDITQDEFWYCHTRDSGEVSTWKKVIDNTVVKYKEYTSLADLGLTDSDVTDLSVISNAMIMFSRFTCAVTNALSWHSLMPTGGGTSTYFLEILKYNSDGRSFVNATRITAIDATTYNQDLYYTRIYGSIVFEWRAILNNRTAYTKSEVDSLITGIDTGSIPYGFARNETTTATWYKIAEFTQSVNNSDISLSMLINNIYSSNTTISNNEYGTCYAVLKSRNTSSTLKMFDAVSLAGNIDGFNIVASMATNTTGNVIRIYAQIRTQYNAIKISFIDVSNRQEDTTTQQITATYYTSVIENPNDTLASNEALYPLDTSTVEPGLTDLTTLEPIQIGNNQTTTNGPSYIMIGSGSSAGVGAIAIGNGAYSQTDGAIVLGNVARVLNSSSIAIGNNAYVSSANSMGIGKSVSVTAANATAIGTFSAGGSANTIAIGTFSNGGGINSIAIGIYAKANSTSTVSLGANSFSGTVGAIAIGSGANSPNEGAISIGSGAVSNDSRTIAIGNLAISSGLNSIVVGATSTVNANYAIAIGSQTAVENSSQYGIAIGRLATSSSIGSISIGFNAKSILNSSYSVSIGYQANVGGDSSIAVGDNASTFASNAIAIGTQAAVYNNSNEAIVIGSGSTTNGLYSVAIGVCATTRADSSISMGVDAYVYGTNSIAIGERANTFASNSIAIGTNSVMNVGATRGITIGSSTFSGSPWGVVIGSQSSANDMNSGVTLVGSNSLVTGTATVAVGYAIRGNTTPVNHVVLLGSHINSVGASSGSIAVGGQAKIAGENTIAIGYASNANSNTSTVIGSSAKGNGNSVVAIGYSSNSNGIGAISVGRSASAYGLNCIAIGYATTAASASGHSISIGSYGNSTGTMSVSIGAFACAVTTNSVTVGSYASSSGSNSIAIGTLAKAENTYAIGIGANSYSGGSGAIAIGFGANAPGVSTISIGYGATSYTNSVTIGSGASAANRLSVAIGESATTNNIQVIAIGALSNANGISAISIGHNSIASVGGAVSLGGGARAIATDCVAVGNSSVTNQSGSVAVGNGARGNQMYGVAIGYNANVSGTGTQAQSAIAIGISSLSNGDSSIAVGQYTEARSSGGLCIGTQTVVTANYSTAIGYNATVSTTNTISLGSSEVSSLRCQVNLTVTSDERDKIVTKEVIPNTLDFITKLEPKQYVANPRDRYRKDNFNESDLFDKYGYIDYDKEEHGKGTKAGERKRLGFIAQEVQETLKDVYGEEGENFACLINDDYYGYEDLPEEVENHLTMDYVSLVPFLVGAIKELKTEVDELKKVKTNNKRKVKKDDKE